MRSKSLRLVSFFILLLYGYSQIFSPSNIEYFFSDFSENHETFSSNKKNQFSESVSPSLFITKFRAIDVEVDEDEISHQKDLDFDTAFLSNSKSNSFDSFFYYCKHRFSLFETSFKFFSLKKYIVFQVFRI